MPNKSKPTGTKRKQGTYRRDRAAKNEAHPAPVAGIPQPPIPLTDYATEEWERIAPYLQDCGLLTHADVGPLALYCRAIGEIRECDDVMREDGAFLYVYDEATKIEKITKHPAAVKAHAAAQVVRTWATEFGITPSARAKLNVEPPKEKSELEKLLSDDEQQGPGRQVH